VRTPEQETRRDALHDAALMVDELREFAAKPVAGADNLYLVRDRVYQRVATALRHMADPPEGVPT
jgi:hypothetical protein